MIDLQRIREAAEQRKLFVSMDIAIALCDRIERAERALREALGALRGRDDKRAIARVIIVQALAGVQPGKGEG